MFAHIIAALPLLSLVLSAPTAEKRDGVQVIQNCVNSGQVALTFDDGPYLWEQTAASDLNGGKATFFLNGNNYGCIYNNVDQIRALFAANHTIASHTWSHPDLTKLNESAINDELSKIELAFSRILGVRPLYFRPPFGSYNDLVLKVLTERGYKKAFLWSDDTNDANGATVQASEAVYDGVIKTFPAPHIILNHSPIQTTPSTVIPYAVPKLLAAGYQLVTVDTCLGTSGEYPYVQVGQPGTPDATWTCS